MLQTYINIRPALNDIRKLQYRLQNPSIMLSEIGDYVEGTILEGFRKEADPYGVKWAPLSPATINEKQRKDYPRNILIRTKRMKDGIRSEVQGKVLRITVPFPGQFHQSGTKKMPARKILPEGNRLPRRMERDIQDIMVSYLDV